MDYSQIVPEAVTVFISAAAAAIVSLKVMQAVMNEKLKHMKTSVDEVKSSTHEEVQSFRDEVLVSMANCKEHSRERYDSNLEYIKRVEANKADRSEVNLVIEATRRIEQKLDLLILREVK